MIVVLSPEIPKVLHRLKFKTSTREKSKEKRVANWSPILNLMNEMDKNRKVNSKNVETKRSKLRY
jgi:hypothetical protein